MAAPTVLSPRWIVDQGYVKGFDENLIQGNSLDCRLGQVYKIDGGITLHRDGRRELPAYELVEPLLYPEISQGDSFQASFYHFTPQHLYQIEFMEEVNLPNNVCGITLLRSSMAKAGVTSENGLYDSGYSGSTGMSLAVKFDSTIESQSAVAQMLFFSADSSKLYNGFYHNKDWRQVVR